MSRNLLIVFVKNPELGKCKTRLAATVGDEQALVFYKSMLQHTKTMVGQLSVEKHIYYSSFIDKNDLWLDGDGFTKKLQTAGDLGDKMYNAFEQGFASGFERICIIGSDCYALDAPTIEQAFEALKTNEAVIGPSTDGGYYLLGMNKPIRQLFYNKAWSTQSVTADTEADLKALGYNYQMLKQLTDIDNEADLETIPKATVDRLLGLA